jgi:hypothetical protein
MPSANARIPPISGCSASSQSWQRSSRNSHPQGAGEKWGGRLRSVTLRYDQIKKSASLDQGRLLSAPHVLRLTDRSLMLPEC